MHFKKWLNRHKKDRSTRAHLQFINKDLVTSSHHTLNKIRSFQDLLFHATQVDPVDLRGSILENHEQWQKLLNQIHDYIEHLDITEFFSDYGLLDSDNFIIEVFERTIFKVLPIYKDPYRFSTLSELFLKDLGEIEQVESQVFKTLRHILKIIDNEHKTADLFSAKLSHALFNARHILRARLFVLCCDPLFRERIPSSMRYTVIEENVEELDNFTLKISGLISEVYADLNQTGVSIELVFLIEKIKDNLDRLSLIQSLIESKRELPDISLAVLRILNSKSKNQSTAHFLSQNLSLISKKIVDRAGITAEHYIARTKTELAQLIFSASGGGLLTVITTYLKAQISLLKLPLFIEGMAAWLNYTLSFYTMQLLGLTLATKTPAMTAPALSNKLKNIATREQEFELVTEARHIIRSGFWSAFSNVIFVVLGACVADYFKYKYTGTHFFEIEQSHKYIDNHNPLSSLTVWFAVYTGVILWLGSAIGGWFENWFVFRKIPQAITESHRLNGYFGKTLSEKISGWVSHGMMSFATNVALGFLLAFSSIWGKFFGIPLDVRHVTLSSGTLAFSYMALPITEITISMMTTSFVSVALIGTLNFAISFTVSFLIAANARELKLSDYPHLFKLIFKSKT